MPRNRTPEEQAQYRARVAQQATRDRQVARETVRPSADCHHCNPGAEQTLVLRLYTLGDDGEQPEGEWATWQHSATEAAVLVRATERRMTLRSWGASGEPYEWDAYRYDFGGEVGEQWAYGSSAELLQVDTRRAPASPLL